MYSLALFEGWSRVLSHFRSILSTGRLLSLPDRVFFLHRVSCYSVFSGLFFAAALRASGPLHARVCCSASTFWDLTVAVHRLQVLRFFDDERALRVSARCGTLCISTSIMRYGFGEHFAEVSLKWHCIIRCELLSSGVQFKSPRPFDNDLSNRRSCTVLCFLKADLEFSLSSPI